MASSAASLDVELLLDRLLSASTPTDCLDSLADLQSACKLHRPRKDAKDPKSHRPSQQAELDAAQKEAEAAEEERQRHAVDALLGSKAVLRALCRLVASSTLPSQHNDAGGGMEVEGGDIAACELLLEALPTPPSTASNDKAKAKKKKATTEALQRERQQRRRLEYISKTLLHFHESSDDDKGGPMDGGDSASQGLTPSLLDCLCASPSSGSTTPAPSVYARVLSLQLLQSLLSASPGTLREQLMRAPDGINRLVDLLGYNSIDAGESAADVPEEVRNQAILFLTSLASSSSVLARLITFSEGYDRALKIALEGTEGGRLSSGSTVAMDCLGLCLALAHADDVARELFLGGGDGRGNLDRLARLVDLRGGERFRDKERNLWWDRELKERRKNTKTSETGGKKDSAPASGDEGKQQKDGSRKTGRRGKRQEEDDLDDILRGASTTPKAAASEKLNDATPTDESQQSKPAEPEGPPAPYLTPDEENIVGSVFDLLLVLLLDGEESTTSNAVRSVTDASRSKRRGRVKTVMSHDLARLIVDCALYTLPPPGVDYVSAIPPAKLQQKALVAMAVLGSLGDTVKGDTSDSEKNEAKKTKEAEVESKLQTQLLFETMPIYLHGRVTAIDRLMYLCCTGAYTPGPSIGDESEAEVVASLLSTYSVSAFRSCLPPDMATRMVLHALAPPPPDEADESGAPMEPPVVTRLVMTLADNLRFLQQQDGAPSDMLGIFRAAIGASGSAGALGVFLASGEGDATREMLLRLPPPPPPPVSVDGPQKDAIADHAAEAPSSSLIDFILQHVANYDPGASSSNKELHASSAYVTTTLLALLCDWVVGMPRAVSEVLSSPSSVSIGVLLRSKRSSSSGTAGAVPALSGLLLGLCLEYMADSSSDTEGSAGSSAESSAWTRETIVEMIESMGVGKYLSALDEWKGQPLPLPYCEGTERSSLEQRVNAEWYGRNVTLVRRRVVVALAGSRGEEDSDDDDGAGDTTDGKPSSSLRSLRKMVSSQMAENEDLQTKLDEALSTMASQATQIKELKRVAELGTSADTTDMIDEYTEKVAELEKAKAEAAKEAERQLKLQEEALAAKAKEIESVRQELGESQARVEEMRRDNETLAGEVSGLSAAYNSLEEQYNRGNGSSFAEMTAGGGTSENEGAGDQRSPSGEAAAEDPGRAAINSHEIQSLRDDNARLREDVRAANEWMSMAVGKMDEMGRENESLARSLEEARISAQAVAGAGVVDDSALQGELDILREEARRAQEEGDAAKLSLESEIKAKDEELSGQRALVLELEGQIEELKQSSTSTQTPIAESQAMEESKDASAEQIQELESLRQANKDAQEWMASAVTHVDMLTKQVQEKDEQLEQMTSKLEAASEVKVAGTNDEADAKIAGLEQSLQDVTSERNELQESLETMKEEISALQKSNEDLSAATNESKANDMAAEALQNELDSIKAENMTLTSNLAEFQSWSETAQSRMAEIEAQLQEAVTERDELRTQLEKKTSEGDASTVTPSFVAGLEQTLADTTTERDELQKDLAKVTEEMSALQVSYEERKTESDSQPSNSSMEALQKELEQVKAENVTLTSNLSEFQSWSDTAQSRMSEIEAQLQEMTTERDELKSQLEKGGSGADLPSSPDASQIETLQQEIRDKTEQLEKMQDQLFEDAEEHEAENEKLLNDLELERQRVQDLTQKEQETSAKVGELSLEKERLSSTLSEKQSMIDSLTASKHDVDLRAEEAIRRISELETAKSAVESQVEKLMTLEDVDGQDNLNEQLAIAVAERNELKSQLEDMTEEYEEARKSLERIAMENGNFSARNQALEQDNRSLEYQFAEAEGKIKEKDGLLATAADEKSTLESALEEMKRFNEETVEEWQARTKSLESDLQTFQDTLEQQQKEAAEVVAQWESRCSSLEGSGENVIQQWQERVDSLEADIQSLKSQLATQEKEAAEAITQWEARCSALEGSGGDVVQQWEERVKTLEAELESLESQLSEKDNEAAEAVLQWKARCEDMQKSDENVIRQWEERVTSLENQLEQQETEAAEVIAEWETRCSTLEESGGEIIAQWEERVKALEADVASLEGQIVEKDNEATDVIRQWEEKVQVLENQVVDKENEAAEAIAQWQERCSALEDSGSGAVHQWEERVQLLEGELGSLKNELEQKEQELAQSSAKCLEAESSLTSAKNAIETMTNRIESFEIGAASMTSQIDSLTKEMEQSALTIESMQQQLIEKDDAIASSDEQVTEMAKDLVEAQNQSEQVVKQWQERSEQLEVNITELEEALESHEKSANEAIAQWESRCTTLNEKIEGLELELAATEQDTTVGELKAEVKSLSAQLETSKADNEQTHGQLKESRELLAARVKEWEEKEASFNSSIEKLENKCSDQQKMSDEGTSSIDSLRSKCAALEGEIAILQHERKDALREGEESQVVILELKEELRHAKEELQSFATDQFSAKATEMATQALRQQMVEIRSQYVVDKEALASEREARRSLEEEAQRLKADLALLAQVTEYNEEVDVYVRTMAKKVCAQNVKNERKEMEQLRSTIERLREELGSCRWKERELEEKATNARLQMSILEQEVSAAKTDLALMETAMEELENSKIEMSVSLEYRVEALENERLLTGQAYEEEINSIKAELAMANQERDGLAHKLEQSEKANAALVYSTSHDGLGGDESESEVIKLQLERAQLLAKINEMGTDLERRVREAVAAQASSSEAELIVEKQSRLSVESSLADALSELNEIKIQMAEHSSMKRRDELADKELAVQDLEESLDDMRMTNDELKKENNALKTKLDVSDKENKTTIEDLRSKLLKAEERLRSEDRASRFEAAIAAEIDNLRSSQAASQTNGNQRQSQALVLREIDGNMRPSALFEEGKESVDRNSAYIIEMYDYVVELKQSITEERQMYRDLLAEHEDLLALLGQTGLDFSACE